MMKTTYEEFCKDAAKQYEDFLALFFWQMMYAHPEQTRMLLCQIGLSQDESERLVTTARQDGEGSISERQLVRAFASAGAMHRKYVEAYAYRMMYDESSDFYDAYKHAIAEEETSA